MGGHFLFPFPAVVRCPFKFPSPRQTPHWSELVNPPLSSQFTPTILLLPSRYRGFIGSTSTIRHKTNHR
ncbi:hypothetical protein B9Z19DRAFT_1109024 [Tuber borchii]|uniref:Uncharacterized protein n=1 Tax=Tuber borchii TaxID=42251 RepID=A0A2T6ZNW5_TUBBO|nr:hypothetical protein B9Z19DRAFT_1109024 [Tuber borchii]